MSEKLEKALAWSQDTCSNACSQDSTLGMGKTLGDEVLRLRIAHLAAGVELAKYKGALDTVAFSLKADGYLDEGTVLGKLMASPASKPQAQRVAELLLEEHKKARNVKSCSLLTYGAYDHPTTGGSITGAMVVCAPREMSELSDSVEAVEVELKEAT